MNVLFLAIAVLALVLGLFVTLYEKHLCQEVMARTKGTANALTSLEIWLQTCTVQKFIKLSRVARTDDDLETRSLAAKALCYAVIGIVLLYGGIACVVYFALATAV